MLCTFAAPWPHLHLTRPKAHDTLVDGLEIDKQNKNKNRRPPFFIILFWVVEWHRTQNIWACIIWVSHLENHPPVIVNLLPPSCPLRLAFPSIYTSISNYLSFVFWNRFCPISALSLIKSIARPFGCGHRLVGVAMVAIDKKMLLFFFLLSLLFLRFELFELVVISHSSPLHTYVHNNNSHSTTQPFSGHKKKSPESTHCYCNTDIIHSSQTEGHAPFKFNGDSRLKAQDDDNSSQQPNSSSSSKTVGKKKSKKKKTKKK